MCGIREDLRISKRCWRDKLLMAGLVSTIHATHFDPIYFTWPQLSKFPFAGGNTEKVVR
jgi:hypothetical protein